MWNWWRRRSAGKVEKLEELRGKPVRPRTKTYSSDKGFVYQYVYKGWRSSNAGVEHHFLVTGARGTSGVARIELPGNTLSQCAAIIRRPVLGVEQYAIAKLTLFDTLDTIDTVEELAAPQMPSAESMADCLRRLDRL